MKADSFYRCITREFFSLLELEGRGSAARLQKEMGLSRAYFSQWKAGKAVSIPRLLEALELLRVPAARFFATALASEGPEEFPDLSSGEFGRILAEKEP